MGSSSEQCRWLSDRQWVVRSDPTDSSHWEAKVETDDVGQGSGWTGSTKSLRNEAYGYWECLGCGCCRAVCASSPLVRGPDMGDGVGDTLSACSDSSSSILGFCVSVCVNRALFAGNGSLSFIASSLLFRACIGVGSPANPPLCKDDSRWPCGSPVLSRASSSVSCRALESFTRERRQVHSLETPPFMMRNVWTRIVQEERNIYLCLSWLADRETC